MRLIPAGEFPKEITRTPTDDLIRVYKVCVELEALCRSLGVGGLCAAQVGVPWVLSVYYDNGRWRHFLNYSYTTLSDKKINALVRFVNVEQQKPRYFLMKRYESVSYHLHELVVAAQPELVEVTGTDAATGLFIQNECELLCGGLPHVDGEEYWLRK